MAEIPVHIDTLEYTRDGLKTREPINLQVGQHNRVVLVRPERIRARGVAKGGFMVGSSFPTPPVLMLGLAVALDEVFQQIGAGSAKEVFQVYGHADATGEDELNKLLSERRAGVVAALLTGDVDALITASETEGWDLREYQIALRVLRCDPGVIDGEPGDVTDAAVELFQREYNAGVFCRHKDLEPRTTLEVDADLGEQTKKALLEALVSACSPELPRARLHPTHPTIGCSEFNRATLEQDAPNRRVSLIAHDALPPYHDQAPCQDGNVGACPLDGQDPRVQCLWYREHVLEPVPEDRGDVHIDLRWLPLPNGRLLLSALTSAIEGESVRFKVWRSGPCTGPQDLSSDNLELTLSDEMVAIVVGGIAQVVWQPPEDFELNELSVHASRRGFAVPVFEVWSRGPRVLSPPMGEDLSRLTTHAVEGGGAGAFAIGRDAFGGLHLLDPEGDAVADHPLTSSEVFIVQGTGAARHRAQSEKE